MSDGSLPNVYYKEYGRDLLASAKRVVSITPDDFNDIPVVKALRVYNPLDTAVNVSIRTVFGDEVVLAFGPGLWREDIQVQRVFETNTTNGVILHGYFDN